MLPRGEIILAVVLIAFVVVADKAMDRACYRDTRRSDRLAR
jgi:hypothetical protein